MDFIRVAKDNWRFEESRTREPFVPLGCNYYDAHTGWPPRLWSRFDRDRVKRDFHMMQDLGMNAIRVWLQWAPFMPSAEGLSPRALEECQELLLFAHEAGIRVNLTGPEFWEGSPTWLPGETSEGYHRFVSPLFMEAHARFWEMFCGRIAQNPVIYGFDLANEPFMPWDGEKMRTLWNLWLRERYGSERALRTAWGKAAGLGIRLGEIPPPPNRKVPGSRYLLDYQTFREESALQWVRNTVDAIRRVDRSHLITVGLHQSGCPLEEIIPSRYTAFNPHLLGSCVDYIALHWYPFGNPLTASCLPFDLPESTDRSLSLFLANCRYSHAGKPLVMEECSYYGGGSPAFWGGVLPHRTVEEQDEYSRRFVAESEGSLGGWLNWPLQDTEQATDTSLYGGFYTEAGTLKPWGRSFRTICGRLKRKKLRRAKGKVVLRVSRTALLTDAAACQRIIDRCTRLFRRRVVWDFLLQD